MINFSIMNIINGLNRYFPVNYFLISRSGHILWANEGMLKASAVSDLKEIKGKHVSIFGQKEWLTTKKVIESNKEEILYETHQGRNFIVVKTPYFEEDVSGVLGFSMDITELELAKRAKTDFIRNMEHDIRTPFNGIWGMANYLCEKETDGTKKEYLNGIVQSAKELLNYCNTILEFSKIEHGMLAVVEKKFNLEDIVNGTIRMELAAAKYKNLELKINYDPNIPVILIGDSYRIHRILINLIGNAIKFTKEGYVELKVRLIRKEINSIFIKFIVEDTGIGIPSEKQEFIFEKFSRLTQSNRGLYKGIGLGLRVVKQFVDELGGEIYLKSKSNQGSKFTCVIPFKQVLLENPTDTDF